LREVKSIGNLVLRKSLPTLIALAAVTTIVLLIGILFIVQSDIKHRHEERVTRVIASYQMAMLEQTRQLQVIANNNLITDALTEPSALTKYFLNSYLDTLDIGTLRSAIVTVVNSKGLIIATNGRVVPESRAALLMADMPWFNQVFVQRQTFHNSDVGVITFVAPIIDEGRSIGAIIAEFNSVDPFLIFNFEDSIVLITNADNRILYTSDRLTLSPFTVLDWTLLPTWRVGYKSKLENMDIYGIEQTHLFFSDFYRLFSFALLSIFLLFVSSVFSARAAGRLAASTIKHFLSSLESSRKSVVKPELPIADMDALELVRLRQEFESLLHSLKESNLSKERVSAMMNSLNDLLVVFDLNGKKTLSNKAFDSFSEQVKLGNSNLLDSLFFGQDLHDILNVDINFTAFEKHYLNYEAEGDKNYFAIRWTRHRQINDFGEITGITFVGMDTTKSNELEAEIKLKDAAIDSADSGIVLLEVNDQLARIIYANKGAFKLIGFEQSKIQGISLSDLASLLGEDKLLDDISSAIASGKSIVQVFPRTRKDGSQFHLEAELNPVHLSFATNKKYYLGILKDVTEQQLTSNLLFEAKQKAEESAQIKSSFLASMSHEIRTPMNGIIGMLDILNESKLNEQQKNYINIAQDSAESLLKLINDILDFSKVEAGKLTIEDIDFNLSDMLDGFADSMAHQALRKNLELVLDTTEINESQVVGDPGRLRQVLTNLVGNAIKFTQRGEIVIHASLQESPNNTLQLTIKVTDTGIGIPHEKQAHLFDPFTQVDGSHTREQQGTGLGLAIVKQMCEAMHGHVWVNSDIGRGSTFGFRIQLTKSHKTSPVLPVLQTVNKKVLVIDDNNSTRYVLCKQLEKWQIQTVACETGEQALQLLENENHGFNAAIVDMNMPVMDGANFGKTVKELPHCKNMKLILMTSLSQRGDAQYFAKMGFAGYFPKPATSTDIVDALSVMFDDGSALSEATPLVTQHYVRSLRRDQTFNKAYRILLVEDNPVNQMISKKYIMSIGLQATVAQDGAVALELLKQADTPFDLILMDCQMPVLDGFEATRKIRIGEAGDRYLNTPIIAMTANAMKGDRENCLDAGMDDYISKPLRRDILVQTLRSWLSRL